MNTISLLDGAGECCSLTLAAGDGASLLRGKREFTLMNATRDIAERVSSMTALITLAVRPDLQYGTMTVEKSRDVSTTATVVWYVPTLASLPSAARCHWTGKRFVPGGGVRPPSTSKFSVDRRDPTYHLLTRTVRLAGIRWARSSVDIRHLR